MQAAINHWTQPLAEALLNGLWQGLLLAALAWLFLRLNPRTGAAGRYAVLYTTLVVILCLPALNLLTRPAEKSAGIVPATFAISGVVEDTELSRYSPLRTTAPLVRFPIELPASTLPGFFVLGWLAVAAILCVRLALACRALQRMKRNSSPVEGRHHSWWRRWLLEAPSSRLPELRVAEEIRLPLTAGLTSPAILFPARLLARLREDEARIIWLHELAHVRRMDDWTKLGQKFAESVLFFHPAVRWLGSRLELEREIACDTWVVTQTGAPKPYAACLAKLAEYAAARPVSCPAPAMAADKKQIIRRVSMLINKNQKQDRNESRAFGLLAAALVLAVAGVMVAADPVLVFADTPPEASEVKPVVAPATPEPPEVLPATPAIPEPVVAPIGVRGAPVGVVGGVKSGVTGGVNVGVIGGVKSGVSGGQPVVASLAPPAPPAPPTPPAPPAKMQEAPAPPAPPKPPMPAPKPAAAPRPAPNSEARATQRADMLAMREELAQEREEMRALSQELRKKIQAEIEPRREELRELSRELRETVLKEIEPEIQKIRELSHKLAQSRISEEGTDEEIAVMHRMVEIEHEIQEKTGAKMAELEGQMRELELEMKPSEEVMRKYEEQMKKVEKRMKEKADQFEKLRKYRDQKNGPESI